MFEGVRMWRNHTPTPKKMRWQRRQPGPSYTGSCWRWGDYREPKEAACIIRPKRTGMNLLNNRYPKQSDKLQVLLVVTQKDGYTYLIEVWIHKQSQPMSEISPFNHGFIRVCLSLHAKLFLFVACKIVFLRAFNLFNFKTRQTLGSNLADQTLSSKPVDLAVSKLKKTALSNFNLFISYTYLMTGRMI